MRARRILTLREVSEMTKTPVNTLRFWRNQGLEKGPRLWLLGAKLVAYEDDVQAWMDQAYETTSSGAGMDVR